MTEAEYENLKRFMGLFYEWFEAKPNHPANVHPVVVLDQIELASKSKARRGLEMAIQDCVEASSGWQAERVAEADKRFLEAGALSLSKVRHDYSKRFAKLLKTGKIERIQDYYLIKGILDGGILDSGTDEEARLRQMLDTFERTYASPGH